MQFRNAIILFAAMAGVVAAASGSTTSTSTVTEDACLAACDLTDSNCRTQCVLIPYPSNTDVSQASDCVDKCDTSSDGTSAGLTTYATCVSTCIQKYIPISSDVVTKLSLALNTTTATTTATTGTASPTSSPTSSNATTAEDRTIAEGGATTLKFTPVIALLGFAIALL